MVTLGAAGPIAIGLCPSSADMLPPRTGCAQGGATLCHRLCRGRGTTASPHASIGARHSHGVGPIIVVAPAQAVLIFESKNIFSLASGNTETREG
jgi:hypothetical protein